MTDGSGLLIFTFLVTGLATALVFALLGYLLGQSRRRAAQGASAAAVEVPAPGAEEAAALRHAIVHEVRQEMEAVMAREEEDLRTRDRALREREEAEALRERSLRDRARVLDRDTRRLREAEEAREARDKAAAEAQARVEATIEEYRARLERLAGIDREEARRTLIESLRAEAKFEAARLAREIRDEATRNAEYEARKIISLAIERMASQITHERSVSLVPIKSEKVKGRVIGHEGRNIRAFEKATGIQVIVDENPEAIVLSGFNPVRRELARMALEALLDGGNIHPRKIEEVVAKCERKLLNQIRDAGQKVARELKIRDLHPDMVELLGRLKYRTSYGQNVLEHSIEVAQLTRMMAAELRLDETLALRAGLLHDIGKAIDYETEGTHPEIGAEVATKYREPDVVVNAIASHHEDVEVTHPISVLVAAADAISGSRPGARRRTLADYVQRVEKLETLGSSLPGVEQCYAIQAGRELRVIAQHDRLDDTQAQLLAAELAKRIQSEVEYPGRIKVTVIRQMRATEVAH